MSPATDPIGSGFVRSYAHPGGNITGVANMLGELTAEGWPDFRFWTQIAHWSIWRQLPETLQTFV
jgi:hypothetical protein